MTGLSMTYQNANRNDFGKPKFRLRETECERVSLHIQRDVFDREPIRASDLQILKGGK